MSKMNFKKCLREVINIDSFDYHDKKRECSSSHSQTSAMYFKEASVQSVRRKSIEIQTDFMIEPQKKKKEDEYKLKEFLQKVEALMVQSLNDNRRSKAFISYNPLFMEFSKDFNRVACYRVNNDDQNDMLGVSSLCWNSSGSILVAGHGTNSHLDCCIHHSYITLCYTDKIDDDHIYNDKNNAAKSSKDEKTFNNNDKNKSTNTIYLANTTNENNTENDKLLRKIDTTIETKTCISILQCHPVIPSILAVGTCNGSIRIIDMTKTHEEGNKEAAIRNDDYVIAETDSKDDHHLDMVTGLSWIGSTNDSISNIELLSSSLDGSIVHWTFNQLNKRITANQVYVVLTESLPAVVRNKVGSRGIVSITCISVCPNDKNVFVCGSDVGAVFKCSFYSKGKTISLERKSSLSVTIPVTTSFAPHKSTIQSIQFCPSHSKLFATSSSDGMFSIYCIDKETPLAQTNPCMGSLFSCSWSPHKATTLIITSSKGDVIVYALEETAKCNEVASYKLPVGVMCGSFNARRPSLYATGDTDGVTTLWKMGGSLYNNTLSDYRVVTCIMSELLCYHTKL